MTELDQALAALNANPEDPKARMDFYGRFLHTIFFVPIQKIKSLVEGVEKEVELPLIIENDGSDFLVFFDDQKRLNVWAEKHAPCVQMPGYAIAEISSPGVWWAMNVGTAHDKQFNPDEIAWLKDVLARSKGAA
ncbi:SseB family protein [Geopsychrobacter electrodiphilus]|uniref:SseB family protein n=1 Tax=Geopsychrobacter electrodiphilus TaxID=225196 RepID=UPI00036729DE|nr:SseB family protein [Geopsychrobacter electrodiphilus]